MPSRIASPSDHPAADVRRPGIRGVALLELAIFFAGAFAVDLLFADGTRFRDIEPHPYWIPVLLLSIQYGTNEGLLAAALASAALLVNNLPAQTLTQDEFDYLFSISYRPIIWFVAAVALGEIRNRQVREREELRRELAASQQEAQTITETYQKMKAVKTDLEVRLASELRTVLSMYEAAKAIDRLNVGEVLSGVGTLLEAIVRPQKYSLFLLNNNVLEAALAEGWAPDDSYARIHTPDSPLFEGVVARQHVLCAARPEDVPLLDGQGVLAGPLRSADTDAIVGMLKIEDVGFLEFNLTTIENFRMLCDWIGTALAKARRYEAMGEDRFHGSSAWASKAARSRSAPNVPPGCGWKSATPSRTPWVAPSWRRCAAPTSPSITGAGAAAMPCCCRARPPITPTSWSSVSTARSANGCRRHSPTIHCASRASRSRPAMTDPPTAVDPPVGAARGSLWNSSSPPASLCRWKPRSSSCRRPAFWRSGRRWPYMP